MEIQKEINDFLNRLNYSWFLEVQRMFLRHPYYDKTKNRIYRIGEDDQPSEDENGNWVYLSSVIDSRIQEYCWVYDFDNERYEGDDLPVEGYWICRQVENIIAKYVTAFRDSNEKLEFIKKSVDFVKLRLDQHRQTATDSEYDLTLKYFTDTLRSQLAWQYRGIIAEVSTRNKVARFMSLPTTEGTPDTIIENDEVQVRAVLKPLNGRWKTTKIMTSEDFEKLVRIVLGFLRSGGHFEVPAQKGFHMSGVPGDFVRRTFYELSEKKIHGKIKHLNWANFLKTHTILYENQEANTIRRKFAAKPKNYTSDLTNTITYD